MSAQSWGDYREKRQPARVIVLGALAGLVFYLLLLGMVVIL